MSSRASGARITLRELLSVIHNALVDDYRGCSWIRQVLVAENAQSLALLAEERGQSVSARQLTTQLHK